MTRPRAASDADDSLVAALTVWGARVAWLVVAVVGGRAIGDALADHDAGAAPGADRRRRGSGGRSARSPRRAVAWPR